VRIWNPVLTSVFVCLLSASLFAAGQQTVRIGIDRDNNNQTGCLFDPGTGDLREGIEVVLEIVIDADTEPPTVQSVRARSCTGSAFGAPLTLDSGWASATA